MAENDVLNHVDQRLGDRLAELFFGGFGLVLDPHRRLDDMAHQLSTKQKQGFFLLVPSCLRGFMKKPSARAVSEP